MTAGDDRRRAMQMAVVLAAMLLSTVLAQGQNEVVTLSQAHHLPAG